MSVPTGVKVISVLYYIGSVLAVIGGLIVAFGGGAVAANIPLIGAIGAGVFIVAGIVMIAFGVLAFFVGKGLWNGSGWARIVAIIMAALGLLGAIMGMVQGNIGSNIVGLIIHGAIGGYLLLNSEVKRAFA